MTLPIFLVFSRWIYFAAVSALFGASLFWFTAGSDLATIGREASLPRSIQATTLLLRVTAPMAAISGIAWLIGILANITGGFGDVLDPAILHTFFFETQFGPVAILRLILFAALVVIVVEPLRQQSFFLATLIISALLLISQAWLGHAAEGGTGLHGAAMIIVYSLHVLAGAAWVGALPPLLFALAEARGFTGRAAASRAAAILSRYSLVGMIAVTLIVLSGIANAGFRVGGAFDKLFWTAYAAVLLIKVAAVALMLIFACFNRFIAMPRLRLEDTKGLAQIGRVRASIAAELALGILVLGIAAILGITPPPQ